MSFAAYAFSATILVAAPVQEPQQKIWEFDADAIGTEWAGADAYFLGERERCEAAKGSMWTCFHILFRHIYFAQAFGEHAAAVELAGRWLDEAQENGMAGGKFDFITRYRLAYSAMQLVSAGKAGARPVYTAVIEELTRAIAIAKTSDTDEQWFVSLRELRAQASAGLAAEELSSEERRITLWNMATVDLREAVAIAERYPGEFPATRSANFICGSPGHCTNRVSAKKSFWRPNPRSPRI